MKKKKEISNRSRRSIKSNESKSNDQQKEETSHYTTFIFTKHPKKETFQTIDLLNPNSQETKEYEEALKNSNLVSEMTMKGPTDKFYLSTDTILKMKYQEYLRTSNPINLMDSFLEAHRAGIYPPLWVLNRIADIFKQYCDSSGKKNLETLFGFPVPGKGRKKGEFFKKQNIEERDMMIMIDVYRLTLLGYKPNHAADLVARLLEELAVENKIGYDYMLDKFKEYKKLFDHARAGRFRDVIKEWLSSEINKKSFLERFSKHLDPVELKPRKHNNR